MKRATHLTASFAILTAAGLLAAGCQPVDKSASKPGQAKPQAAAAKGDAIPGLATEKEQASYMIGMDIAKTMEIAKDEVDVDTMAKAIKTVLSGGKPLMTDEQAQKVREAFGAKMQAKQMAEVTAKAKKNADDGEKFLAENTKKPGVKTTASGVQYQVITEGKGPKPTAEDVVKVHYKGTQLNGKVFDSSYDRGEPAMIPLGGVVPGWREGLLLMPVGSKYTLWIPGRMAYGENVPPGAPIGPNETLVFEVELLDIVKQNQRPAKK